MPLSTDITVQEINANGELLTMYALSESTNTFANSGREMLIVKNGAESSITVTIDSVVPCSYGFDHNITATVPAGNTIHMGVFQPGRFNNENGKVTVTFSEVGGVNAAVVKI